MRSYHPLIPNNFVIDTYSRGSLREVGVPLDVAVARKLFVNY